MDQAKIDTQVKTDTPKPAEPAKKSSREIALEEALKDGIIVVENLNINLSRMGVRSHQSDAWLVTVRELVK
jgi:hypothetical protein